MTAINLTHSALDLVEIRRRFILEHQVHGACHASGEGSASKLANSGEGMFADNLAKTTGFDFQDSSWPVVLRFWQ